jgi:hypothetical protein
MINGNGNLCQSIMDGVTIVNGTKPHNKIINGKIKDGILIILAKIGEIIGKMMIGMLITQMMTT